MFNFKFATAMLAAAALLGVSGEARANTGTCLINPITASGTYAFSGSGVSIGSNPFAPIGQFTQSGTVTQIVTGYSKSQLVGNWSVNLAQNDTSGPKPVVTFGGNFTIDPTTCTGSFFVTAPINLASPAFHVIVAATGDQLRTTSLIPNLLISYDTAQKL